jgi:hypothetical protein
VLRLLAAEGMVSLGTLSLDGSKLAGNAARKANRTPPQIELRNRLAGVSSDYHSCEAPRCGMPVADA